MEKNIDLTRLEIEVTKLLLATETGQTNVILTCPYCKIEGESKITHRENPKLRGECGMLYFLTALVLVYGLTLLFASVSKNEHFDFLTLAGYGGVVFVIAALVIFTHNSNLKKFEDKVHTCGKCGEELGAFNGFEDYVRERLRPGFGRADFRCGSGSRNKQFV